MIVDCISDLHGFYPELQGGDLLIVAGDLTASNTPSQWSIFFDWLEAQRYTKKIYIAGNHDNFLTTCGSTKEAIKMGPILRENIEYLCDSGTEFEGLKIWASPWSKKFKGMNPDCMAFTMDSEDELAEKWELIPPDVDLLITHSPPFGILDGIPNPYDGAFFHVGSDSLYELLYTETLKPKLHVFGHIHEGYGHIPKMLDMPSVQFVNASYVNENYEPVNKPIRVIL